MKSLNLSIRLDRLICHEEGDGSGNAEPYIWAVFFKIDKDTAIIDLNEIRGRRNPAEPVQIKFSRGSHSNLSSAAIDIEGSGMDAGDNIPIPFDVGSWSTTLKSIKFPNPSASNDVIDIPGVAGVFYILMEEDSVTHAAAEAGHQALNNFFKEKINRFVTGLNVLELVGEARKIPNTPLGNAVIQVLRHRFEMLRTSLASDGERVVISTVLKSLSFPDILGLKDPDDSLGTDLQVITQTELIQNNHKDFRIVLPVPKEFIGGGGHELAGDGLFSITGYFHASPYEEAVIINDIPSANELFIDSTLKHISWKPGKSFILAIGGTHNGKPFVIGRFKALELIKNKSKRFFVRSAFGGSDGVVEILAHPPSDKQRFDYLKTENNESKTDNLWNLPDCKMTYIEP